MTVFVTDLFWLVIGATEKVLAHTGLVSYWIVTATQVSEISKWTSANWGGDV